MKKISIALIRVYQVVLSPLFPASCRFYPTCSEYALQAIQAHGFLRGVGKGLSRLCKCHPFHPGGYDPLHRETNN